MIGYTPFDLPARIDTDRRPNTVFRYAADQRRVVRATGPRTIITVGGEYELRHPGGSAPASQMVYVPGEGGAAAQVEFDADGRCITN